MREAISLLRNVPQQRPARTALARLPRLPGRPAVTMTDVFKATVTAGL